MPKCPQGHDSSTDDFCDVCGEPIAPDAAASANAPSAPSTPVAPAEPERKNSLSLDPPAATPAAPPIKCANCGEENAADALFCEVCGYDFTTGQLPAPAPAAVAATTPVEWVAEIWVDPDWFKAQEAAGTPPTTGPPAVVPLRGNRALIGRVSKSRDLSPQIDCSADGSVSHRHAELTLNSDRWSIEDLGSTNGTFIGATGDPLPSTPITPHQRRELADNERIYIGAWCRVMVRRATDDEKNA